jgi:predicted dehydrogenase
VAVGVTGLDLPRRIYYQKEISFVVSRSYGPGRYDPNFEERGQDYPPGYVRWTERENMRAFLELQADDRVRIGPLISHRIPIEKAEQAYSLLHDPQTFGVVLQYSTPSAPEKTLAEQRQRIELKPATLPQNGSVGMSLIGAGAFAQEILLPQLKKMRGVEFRGVVTGTGVSARLVGDRLGFRFCASETEAVWEDSATHSVLIATRNNLHGTLVLRALETGKAVLVEKPLCITEEELDTLVRSHQQAVSAGSSPLVMVGFNRRFAPTVQAVRGFFGKSGSPLTLHYRVNAGRLPDGSWVSDPLEGGGRILSEYCHFVDLSAYLIGVRIVSVFAQSVGSGEDDLVVTLTFEDGSLATIGFYSNGDRSYSKERIEVFGAGKVAVIDDFRTGLLVREGRRRRIGGWWSRQQKGHREEIEAFLEAVRKGGTNPVPFEEAVRTTRATFAIRDSLSRGVPVTLAY